MLMASQFMQGLQRQLLVTFFKSQLFHHAAEDASIMRGTPQGTVVSQILL
jgi:hypothetical protein